VFGVLALPSLATANDAYPTKAIRVVVPVSPGFATDFLARLVTDKLRLKLGQVVIVGDCAMAAAIPVPADRIEKAQEMARCLDTLGDVTDLIRVLA